ncbi:MAG: molybdenum ABC transporter ATP-binding protein [Gemmobacter sp.]
MTLEVQLAHDFGGFALDAEFAAPDGVTVLFGRSGSGKTSVVNAVAGILRPDRGKVTAQGIALTDTARGLHLPPFRRRIGYVFQEPRLFPHLTVAQNLGFGRWFAPRDAAGASPERIIALLGLEHLLARRPHGLSGGEKQRVAIGRAILSKPRLLLMDEPLAALDAARRDEILPYLERLREELGLPILYVSHSAVEVARLATTLVLIEGGRVRKAGPAAQLMADPALAPAFGLRELGAIIRAQVAAHEADGLTRLITPAGALWVPHVEAPPGTHLRLRVPASDVTLALTRPEGVSALNILPARITAIRRGDGPGALVQLDCGGELLLARVTQRSVESMRLAPGMDLHVMLKALSVAPQNMGGD